MASLPPLSAILASNSPPLSSIMASSSPPFHSGLMMSSSSPPLSSIMASSSPPFNSTVPISIPKHQHLSYSASSPSYGSPRTLEARLEAQLSYGSPRSPHRSRSSSLSALYPGLDPQSSSSGGNTTVSSPYGSPRSPNLRGKHSKPTIPLPFHYTPEGLVNRIVVIPLEGRNFASKDLFLGRSDPYCRVHYGCQAQKTKWIEHHLHPVWATSAFVFDLEPYATEVRFSVWDKNIQNDGFLGEVSVSLPTQKLDAWFTLKSRPNKKDEVSGQLHIQIYRGESFPVPEPDPSGGWSIYNYRDLIDGTGPGTPPEKLKTGDVIFFSGTEWISGPIKKYLNTPYSHCGIVVIMANPRHPELQIEPFLIEADWDDQDFFQDAPIDGIVANRFEERMHNYVGDALWYAPLKEPLSPADEKKLVDYVLELKGNKTKFGLGGGLTMMLKIENKEDEEKDKSKYFCSELVAAAFKKVGICPPGINASMMGPYDVAKFDCLVDGICPGRVLRYHIYHKPKEKFKDKAKKLIGSPMGSPRGSPKRERREVSPKGSPRSPSKSRSSFILSHSSHS